MFPKIGVFTPKMDGENNGKPYEQMDDLGGTIIFGNMQLMLIVGLGPLVVWIPIESPKRKGIVFFCVPRFESQTTGTQTKTQPVRGKNRRKRLQLFLLKRHWSWYLLLVLVGGCWGSFIWSGARMVGWFEFWHVFFRGDSKSCLPLKTGAWNE